jgi:2'-5' RNA ligase
MSSLAVTPPFKRLFASITPPPDWIRGAAKIKQQLERIYGTAVRWSDPESYHITARFLGNLPPHIADSLIATWSNLGENTLSAPTISPEPCGCFPEKTDPPRVIWIGAQASTEWDSILAHIDKHLSSLGIDYRSDASIPHLTLGRVKDPHRVSGLREKVSSYLLRAKPFCAEEIDLMLSTPSPTGSTYTRLSAFTLVSGAFLHRHKRDK